MEFSLNAMREVSILFPADRAFRLEIEVQLTGTPAVLIVLTDVRLDVFP